MEFKHLQFCAWWIASIILQNKSSVIIVNSMWLSLSVFSYLDHPSPDGVLNMTLPKRSPGSHDDIVGLAAAIGAMLMLTELVAVALSMCVRACGLCDLPRTMPKCSCPTYLRGFETCGTESWWESSLCQEACGSGKPGWDATHQVSYISALLRGLKIIALPLLSNCTSR